MHVPCEIAISPGRRGGHHCKSMVQEQPSPALVALVLRVASTSAAEVGITNYLSNAHVRFDDGNNEELARFTYTAAAGRLEFSGALLASNLRLTGVDEGAPSMDEAGMTLASLRSTLGHNLDALDAIEARLANLQTYVKMTPPSAPPLPPRPPSPPPCPPHRWKTIFSRGFLSTDL